MLPKMVNFNGVIYNTVGMVKLNNGAFLISKNSNNIAVFDFTQISSLYTNPNFEVKKPTTVEIEFINYIQNRLQERINNKKINGLSELFYEVTTINRYVNNNQQLLANMSQLDNKDNIVKSQKENLLRYFEEEMSNLEIFKDPSIENESQPIPNQSSDDLESKNEEYDEQIVDTILQQQISNPNFDISRFVNTYLSNFSLSQIEKLLTVQNKLSDEQKTALNKRKDLIQSSDLSKNQMEPVKTAEKRKKFIKIQRKSENAFVDTILLSFTVGTVCGVYLMYFVLTIMS